MSISIAEPRVHLGPEQECAISQEFTCIFGCGAARPPKRRKVSRGRSRRGENSDVRTRTWTRTSTKDSGVIFVQVHHPQ